MKIEPLPEGAIIRYPYLWAAERNSGETAGRKPRPVCLVLRLYDERDSIHHLILLPITSKSLPVGRVAIEVPEMERRRAGLMRYARAWVIADEYNYDIAERLYHLDADGVLGNFSPAFLRRIATILRENLGKRTARVDRTARSRM
jgi:hypothetical protein